MFKKKDQQLLAEAYGQILNEGLFDLFKKKQPQQEQPQQEQPSSETRFRGRAIKVSVFGKPQEFDEYDLMNNSETVETVPSPSGGTVVYELNIYKTFTDDIGSYRDVDIFIPVVLLVDDQADYPRPPVLIKTVSKQAYQTKEEALKAGKELLQNAVSRK